MGLRLPSASNGFLPKLTGEVVAFIRDPAEFAINEYIQYRPSELPIGAYLKIGRDEGVRHVTDEEDAWEDGDELGEGEHNKIPFEMLPYRTKRRALNWRLGHQMIEVSKGVWDPKSLHIQATISKMMTKRTWRIWRSTNAQMPGIDVDANAATLWGVNNDSANSLNGGRGYWDTASDDPNDAAHYQAIWRTLTEAWRRIHLATNGRVKKKDLRVVLSPNAAIRTAQSAEISNYVRETPQAVKILKQDGLDPDREWVLPEHYRGFRFVVEDAPLVSERLAVTSSSDNTIKEATTNRTYIKRDDTAVILSRPGGLDMSGKGPSMSTVQIYHYGGLARVKAEDDSYHELVRGAVTENLTHVVAAAVAGFRITGIMTP